jgi:hypothetical protein
MIMKRLVALFVLPVILFSCEKEEGSYTQIKSNENLIYLAIKAYRSDNGLGEPFVHQFIMVREAQIYSYKMANDAEDVGTQGLTEHWNTIHEKIGGYNDQALVLKTTTDDEDGILAELLQIPNAESILLEDLTQCGVGVESDTDGNNYVTILLMKVDS